MRTSASPTRPAVSSAGSSGTCTRSVPPYRGRVEAVSANTSALLRTSNRNAQDLISLAAWMKYDRMHRFGLWRGPQCLGRAVEGHRVARGSAGGIHADDGIGAAGGRAR